MAKNKALYTAIFLSGESSRRLKRWVVAETLHPLKMVSDIVHYVPLEYEPSEVAVKSLPLGANVKMKVVGFCQNEDLQLVGVKLLSKNVTVKSSASPAHVLVSFAQKYLTPTPQKQQKPNSVIGVPPVSEVKALLAQGFSEKIFKEELILEGRVGFYDGSEAVYQLDGTVYDDAVGAEVKKVVQESSQVQKGLQKRVAYLSRLGVDKKVMDYVREKARMLEDEYGYPPDYAFPVAWSIYCRYKSDEIKDTEGSCTMNKTDYFKEQYKDWAKARKEKSKKKAGLSRTAKVEIEGFRQQTQYTCVAASLAAALKALGKDVTEQDVNRVLQAKPLQGARWEEAMAAAQYFGVRGTLIVPCTLKKIKEHTDAGKPVLIAWNPQNRPWSHASMIVDVTDNLDVQVMDPNIPDPEEVFHFLNKTDFYSKWCEKWSDSLIVRRPALLLDLEVDSQGRQVMAATTTTVSKLEPIMNRRTHLRGQSMKTASRRRLAAKTMTPKELFDYLNACMDHTEDGVVWSSLISHFERAYRALDSNYEEADKILADLKGKIKNSISDIEDVFATVIQDAGDAIEMLADDPEDTDSALSTLRQTLEFYFKPKSISQAYNEGKAVANIYEIDLSIQNGEFYAEDSRKDLLEAEKFFDLALTDAEDCIKGLPASLTEVPAKTASRYNRNKGRDMMRSHRRTPTATRRRLSRFEKGKEMTIEEVAAVVGPEFKEMNENPPEEVVKLKEEMQKKARRIALLSLQDFERSLRAPTTVLRSASRRRIASTSVFENWADFDLKDFKKDYGAAKIDDSIVDDLTRAYNSFTKAEQAVAYYDMEYRREQDYYFQESNYLIEMMLKNYADDEDVVESFTDLYVDGDWMQKYSTEEMHSELKSTLRALSLDSDPDVKKRMGVLQKSFDELQRLSKMSEKNNPSYYRGEVFDLTAFLADELQNAHRDILEGIGDDKDSLKEYMSLYGDRIENLEAWRLY